MSVWRKGRAEKLADLHASPPPRNASFLTSLLRRLVLEAGLASSNSAGAPNLRTPLSPARTQGSVAHFVFNLLPSEYSASHSARRYKGDGVASLRMLRDVDLGVKESL